MTTQDEELRSVAEFLLRLQNRRSSEPIDVEIEWPPPDDGVHLVASTGMLIHGQCATRIGEHYVRSTAWGGNVDLDEAGICELLRNAARLGPRRVEGGPPIYLRVHDSNSSRSLGTGLVILDRMRPDRVPAPRRPIRVFAGSLPIDAIEGQELRRGEKLSASRSLVGADLATPSSELARRFLELGIRVALEPDGDTISHLTYIHPYPRKVCGVWIGASVSEVDAILGTAADEPIFGRGNRGWIYEHDGHLCVCFDENDCVAAIVR
jgi:hypothetical protein